MATKAERVKELELELEPWIDSYHNGGSTHPSDDVYEARMDELRELDPDNRLVKQVGAEPASLWTKVRHTIPMGSLEKVNTPQELTSWVMGVREDNAPAHNGVEDPLFVTEKLDGFSISVEYVDGVFSRALTRGKGEWGEDISQNVVKMRGLPARLPVKTNATFRGEIIMLKSVFEEMLKQFPEYSNTRNAAAGIARRSDGTGCDQLTVMLYRIADGLDIPFRSKQVEWLQANGFLTPNSYLTSMQFGRTTPQDIWVQYQQDKRDQLDYDIDGLVVELDSEERQLALGENDGRPRGATAFKFASYKRETVSTGILNPTGPRGTVTPVATFEPVTLVGAEVKQASLYNWRYIRQIKFDVGARILVERANDVIPRVHSVVLGTGTVAQPPTNCSSCDAVLEKRGEYLFCPNESECPAQLVGRLLNYMKGTKILEWGDKVLKRLVEGEIVRSVGDLYRLKPETLANVDRMGDKSAATLLANLWEKNPLPLEVFLGSLCIPGCAESTITHVMDGGFETLAKIRAAKQTQLAAVKGLGPVKSQSIFNWLQKNGGTIDDCLTTGLKIQDRIIGKFTGSTFCFTGKMKRGRDALEVMAKEQGATIKGTVGKGLTYLVMSDPTSSSTKAVAARKNGTKTISEEEFLGLLRV